MKETKKIILISCLILIFPAILGVFVNNNIIKKTSADSHKFSTPLLNYTDEEIKKIKYEEILSGDYSILQGEWRNQEGKNFKKMTVDSGALLIDGQRYFLNLGGKTDWGVPYLNTRSENSYKNSAKLTFYPEGTPIPVRLENGEVDYTGQYDPSDQSKDRLLFTQTVLSVKSLESNVCYRKIL